ALRAGRSLRRCPHAHAGQRLRNPHHVGNGVADLVVQALCRQRCVENESHRRQCRHGGRERMRPRFGAVLTLLTALTVAGFARAEDAQTCEVPAYLLTTDSTLSKVADAIK